MTRPIEYLVPQWPAPACVRAVSTTRLGGSSTGNWRGLNLALHVGDDAACVAENRRRLAAQLQLPASPGWLTQVHGTQVCELPSPGACTADAATSARPGQVCVVMTADCLPVLFSDRDGGRVAAAHAGWRGLAAGVLERSVACFEDPGRVFAWLGPAIGPEAFEVGEEVRAAFVGTDPAAAAAFQRNRRGRWQADLYTLARRRLQRAGVAEIYGGGLCTHSDAGRFYSFRRDGITGRMASLIWIQP